MLKFKFSIVLTSIIILASCKNESTQETTQKTAGFSLENMDTTVSPKEDFNLYVNGSWIKNNPVPETESRWGSFNEVKDRNEAYLKDILESAASKSDNEKGTNLQKVGDFYFTAMDSVSLNKNGIGEIMDKVTKIDNITDLNSLIVTLGEMKKFGVGGFFGLYVTTDSKNSNQYISYLSQGGLNLPDLVYYLNDAEPYATWQAQYREHISKMLGFMNLEDTDAKADAIFNLEKEISKISMDRVTRRDPDTTYNKMSIAELKELNTNINWDGYFEAAGGIKVDSIVVSQPYFITEVNKIMTSIPIEVWKDYLKWNLINSTSEYLSDEISEESFNFYSKTLRGTKIQKPRRQRAIESTDRNLGEILGQEYVKVAFSEDAKNQVYEMVDMIQAAYAERIKNLEWMSEETKEKALYKLSTFKRKLGYPDVWKDMSALQVERDSYVKNIFRAREFWNNYMLSKLGKPVDRNEWGMTPSTVNAYYNPGKNEIVFPAGIMQPPFFDPNADAAVNFGGIGGVIGHELSHGFDDKGSKYDAEGNLKNWWSHEDLDQFKTKTSKIINQFDNYVVLDTIHVNGKLTTGENIADLGGITLGYYAYQKYLEKYGREDIEGFTPEQRFFIGWAQVWRMAFTDQELIRRVKTDPHSPGMFRANGPISNFVPFYQAWDIKEGDGMYRNDSIRVEIW